MLAFRCGEIMRNSLLVIFSVAIVLSMGSGLAAEESTPSIWNNFSVGGYSSAALNMHPGGSTEGAINEIGLLLSWENESRFRFLTELDLDRPLSFNSASSTSSKESYLNLERFYLDYNLSEKLNLRVGRFLTPAGRWNLVHAEPLVWTSSRPLATSRLFPKATNGLMLYGAVPVENNAFEYSFYIEGLKDQIVNNNEIPFEDIKGARFTLTGEVNLGLSLLEFRENTPTEPSYRLLGLDFLVKQEGWEFSGELFQRYNNHYGDGGSGAYLQAVAPLGHQLFAIGRVENYKHPVEGSSDRWLLGGAWRRTPSQIFKVEYIGGDEERTESSKGLLASFAILY
jgi:hypothetical protein